jgi:uncharacterized protein YraI
MKRQILFTFLVLLAIGMACGVSTPNPKEDLLATVVAKTLTAQPVFTALSPGLTSVPAQQLTAIPVASATSGPAGEYYVYTVVDNLNLRMGPGALFQVSRVLLKNTKLKVIGRVPGREWLNVMNDENIVGWVYVDWVKGGYDGPPPPIVQPADVILVTGKVVGSSASPVTGINFAIEQKSASKSLRTDAATDADGIFYAYLPNHLSGVWTVSYVSTLCTSNTMDANCHCIGGACGQPEPVSANVTLPASGQLNFVWK